MKSILRPGGPSKKLSRTVAAIGVFDAVHRGHQRVILRAVNEAKRLGGKSVVVTFHPHPVSVLHPEKFKAYVLTLEHRLRLFESLGVDVCVVLRFDKRFSRMSPEDFVGRILVNQLGVKKVVVGEDFYFGRERSGTADFLAKEGKKKGFALEKIKTIYKNNIKIKTKLIKEFVTAGDLGALRKFLGRPYSMLAKVVHGEARGRKLGFPTANLTGENVVLLPPGIYCARVWIGNKRRNAVFYIGTKPSIKRLKRDVVLEAHVLNFHGNLYGRTILVEFFKKIRDDKHFSGEKELSFQIARDVEKARVFFRKHTSR